ncbi:hypothetical protein BN7_462 [Wickerhamomyces ciferrii]|uniref:RNA polymerase II subunit B1 CTD phosphatase RPAP2 homolog n=1 Tax=Wickerhamomyces ciferrii (strain ATCC 14091 / BCRC 22168 / CBS 111 / JCM 3599 / NBRC 0793 / NRRL Y-1031 F-60-10) TaxID=1206466 RepID=K0KIE4_WICCF|nr:uncharacterized protein BN7_462 [Wickerhamomyces ciferrii]CCH40928.1 hypothetical protein BN7_462 [Wickerhamomyces ciferrii]
MQIITIDSFKPKLLRFSHPDNLSPSAANKLSLSLIEELSEDVCDKFFLKFISRFLTPSSYSEILQERNINKICGYPMCCESPGRIKDHYSKSYQKSKMLPYAYLNLYCSKTHYQCSEFYKTQLSDEAVFARKDITVLPYGSMKYEVNMTLLDEVYDKYNNRSNQSDSIMNIIQNLDSMTLNDTKASKDEMMDNMNQMLQDIKIVEKDPEPPIINNIEIVDVDVDDNTQLNINSDDEDDVENNDKSYEYLQDQSKAINGYVLQV